MNSGNVANSMRLAGPTMGSARVRFLAQLGRALVLRSGGAQSR